MIDDPRFAHLIETVNAIRAQQDRMQAQMTLLQATLAEALLAMQSLRPPGGVTALEAGNYLHRLNDAARCASGGWAGPSRFVRLPAVEDVHAPDAAADPAAKHQEPFR